MSLNLCCALVALVCALAAAPSAYAQAAPPSLGTYEQWLREALAAAQRSDLIGLELAAQRLTATRSVVLPDGSALPVDNAWLQTELAPLDPDLPRIAARLGALIDALAPAATAPADADARLRALLARPPFAEAAPRDLGWLAAFFDWLGRWLERIFAPVGRAGTAASPVAAWVALALGALLVLGALLFVVRGARRGLVRDARQARSDPEAGLTAASAGDQAGELARAGDYRTAVRYMYLAALLRLDERGLLRYERALTNREHLQRLGAQVELREQLTPIVETFDRVWYGALPLDAQGFEQYRRQVERLGEGRG